MPDFEIVLSRTTPDGTWVKSVTVENTTRNLAIPLGMDELFNWCAEEVARDAAAAPVPMAAVDYWRGCRNNGNLQLYEIQSELENKWGLSFVVKQARGGVAPPAVPVRQIANGAARPAPSLPNLETILTERLSLLQARETTLAVELDRLRDEHRDLREDIRQTSELLLVLGQKPARTPKKKAREPEAEGAENAA